MGSLRIGTGLNQRHRNSNRRLALPTSSMAASLLILGLQATPAFSLDGTPALVPVQIATPKLQTVPVYLDGLGVVQSENTVDITPQISGPLESVSFVEGQQVKKGDLLAVIDPRPFRATLDQAIAKISQDQASLNYANYLLNKDSKLAGQEIVTQEALEQQKAQVQTLTAQLAQDQAAKESAEISLSYTEIRSPLSGRTGIRQIDPGNQVTAASTTPIVTITQTDPISVISTLRETDLDKVRTAMASGPVAVAAASVDRTTQLGTGTILLVDNEIDQATGTIKIKSTFGNPDEKLWPGQAVSVRVTEKMIKNALTIPSPALQRGPDGFFVYVVDTNDQTEIKKVKPGPIENDYAVVEEGLSPSDKVVVTGQYRLAPGTKVTATSYTAPVANKE